MKRLIFILIALAVAFGGGALFYGLMSREKGEQLDVAPGEISRVSEMVRLCGTEISSEVPVLDTINGKVLFGIQKQQGSISFDVEYLKANASGDTVMVILPPEIVEVNESTEPGSWRVVDTKSVKLFGRSKLTAEEENRIKAGVRRKAVMRLYRNGTVKRARAEGREMLGEMLVKIYRKPVMVIDPTPNGTPNGNPLRNAGR